VVGIEPVSKRIGHANVTVTSAVYSHLTPDADSRMATAIDSTLTGTTRPAGEPEAKAALAESVASDPGLPPELAALVTKAIGDALGGVDLSALLKGEKPLT
jgi:hypothetical protein